MDDHRKLGRELGIFDTDPLIGAGLPFWLPAGSVLRHTLESWLYAVERAAGYQHVHSPVLGKRELYELSGHLSHYRSEMFPLAADELWLRPSLCPHHALIYRSRPRSYRELPLRLAELGGQYRAELSGVLGGLTRVRAMQLNDGHIFCTLDQLEEEAYRALVLIRDAFAALGISALRYRLSLGGSSAKYAGDDAMWSRASAVLRAVLSRAGLCFDAEHGEAAFYGPKIDVQVADYAAREATMSTVQVDFFQPSRFGLTYLSSPGASGARGVPVMVHRSIVGSIERAVAVLLEQHGGAFPPWLAPVQVVVLPVSSGEESVAASFAASCAALRVSVSSSDSASLGARIRSARLVPYLAVIGPREASSGTVSLRLRDGRQIGPLPCAEAVARMSAGCAIPGVSNPAGPSDVMA